MTLEIRDEIDSAKEFYAKEMPAAVRKAINLCNSHLHSGPLYFDTYGNECSCFDKGAKQFDWNPSLELIRDWSDTIPAVQIETEYNEETNESTYEEIDGSREELLRTLIGRELLRYIQPSPTYPLSHNPTKTMKTTTPPATKTKFRKIPNGQSVVLSASGIECAMTGAVAVFAAADGKCVLKYSDGNSESANCPELAAAIRNYFTGAAEDAPSMLHCVSTIQSAARAVAV